MIRTHWFQSGLAERLFPLQKKERSNKQPKVRSYNQPPL